MQCNNKINTILKLDIGYYITCVFVYVLTGVRCLCVIRQTDPLIG